MTTDTELLLLCQKIHTLRTENQLSQKEMAKKLGIGVATLQKIEQGDFPERIGCSMLQRLHREFGIKFSDMFKSV